MYNLDILREMLLADRSVRRFDNSRPIGHDVLVNLVGLTRYCASGRNLQPLRYVVVSDREQCEKLFPALAWAGYYKDWDGPEESERPVAYLVQCLDTELCKECLCDDGLQLQTITLGAVASGFRGCIIKAFNKKKVIEALEIPERYDPRYVLALGYPAEEVKIVDLKPDGDIKYYRDENFTQCVPKRKVEDLII